jgi:hypothetical protein
MALYKKQLLGTDGFVILTEGKVPGHLTRLDDKGVFSREHATLFVNAQELLDALIGMIPKNICVGNGNVPDDTLLPMDVAMGEIRRAAAVIAKARGAA